MKTEARRVTNKEAADEYHELTEHPIVQHWLRLYSDVCARAGRSDRGEGCPACELLEKVTCERLRDGT